jgi:hypothetical protein
MPKTYTLIKGETITSTTASYAFTSIPSTFTDLVVKISARTDATNPDFMWRINGNTSSIYSDTQIEGDGTSAYSLLDSAIDKFRMQHIGQGSAATSNTFGNYELYFPNYAGATNKVVSFDGVDETNSASSANTTIVAGASLALTTTAISQISFFLNSGNWVSGSSFYLYGIKNS